MRTLLVFFLSLLLSALPVASAGRSIGHQLALDLPIGWDVISDTLAFPVHLASDGASAQLSIFRSEFDRASVVRNATELKGSVQRVIDEVILTLPEAKLLTSTGFNRTDRAGFILEFLSRDTLARLELRHRFEGIIYRLENGNQVMFTLWAKVPREKYLICEEEIKTIQASFEYLGPKEAAVFPPRFPKHMITLVLMLIAAVLSVIAYRNRMKANRKFEPTPRPVIKADRPSPRIIR